MGSLHQSSEKRFSSVMVFMFDITRISGYLLGIVKVRHETNPTHEYLSDIIARREMAPGSPSKSTTRPLSTHVIEYQFHIPPEEKTSSHQRFHDTLIMLLQGQCALQRKKLSLFLHDGFDIPRARVGLTHCRG